MQTLLHTKNTMVGKVAIIMVFFLLLGNSSFGQQAKTYDEAIISADRLLQKSELMDAKAYYQQALKLKPNDAYAKGKISEIITKMKASLAAEDEFYDLVDLGDEFYDNNKLDKALEQYNKALKLIPNDEYTLSKVREITATKTKEKDKIDAFNKSMELGKVYVADKKYDKAIASFTDAASIFPDNEAPVNELVNVRALKANYLQRKEISNNNIDEAEKYLLINNYSVALDYYIKADSIFPENSTIKQKIEEINPKAKIQNKYNTQISKADDYYISQDFVSAKEQYLVAAKLWPEKSYPTDMISKIDDKLSEGRKDLENNYSRYLANGDSLLSAKDYSLAKAQYNLASNLKPNETYPKTKLEEINLIFKNQQIAFEKDYNIMVAKADSLFENKNYDRAKSNYETALTVKPDDNYPSEQIHKIDIILNEIKEQNIKDSKYNELVAQADKLFSSGNYELATKKYREAQAIKSMDSYPQTKIDAIMLILADAKKQKQIDDKYNELLILAVRQFNDDKLSQARESYVNASELKPNEVMPKQQISTIDSLIVVKTKFAELKKQFDALTNEGDSLKKAKQYDESIGKYDEALALFPDNQDVKNKKLSVETIIINIKKEADRKKRYEERIAKGDQLFDAGSYELAKVEFEKAQTIRSDQEYPKNRLHDIKVALEKLEAEKEQRYNQSIVAGDNFFEQANYDEAVIKFNLASSIKPNEKYPKQKIAECNGFIAEKLKKIMAEYSVAIANADKLYASKIYDKAIVAYKKASNIKPDENYPIEMVDKINKYIKENSIVDVISSSEILKQDVTAKFTFEPVKINVRKSNYIFLKAKNLSEKPVKLIFSYGSDKGKNGGFVVQIVDNNQLNDYIVRVGNQYKWFAEDNNWFSIISENGDVEITMLRISKSN